MDDHGSNYRNVSGGMRGGGRDFCKGKKKTLIGKNIKMNFRE